MFTLQDCSVCFEDFDNDRPPHSIPCGHVFCSPCLESLVSTSPTCPNCRVSYSSSSIRKVVCAQQDSAPNPQPNKPSESEAETLMWQAIQSAVESPMEIRQRHSLVEHNTEEAMKDAGLSVNLLTAFNVMRLLVKVEKSHGLLQDKLNTAQAVEQSLCDRISTLEAQSAMGVKPASSSDLQSLLADFQKLQFVVESIDKKTSDIATRLQPGPVAQAQPTPAPIEMPASPASIPIPPTPLEPTRPALLRKPSPRNTINTPSTPTTDQRASFQPPVGLQHQRYPSTPILTGKQPLSPPLTPSHAVENLSDQPLFGSTSQIRRSSSHLTNNLGRASALPLVNQPPPKYQQIEPPNSPAAPLLRSRTPSAAALSSPAAERVLPSPPSTQNRTSVPIPTPTPTPTPIPVPTSTTISPPPAPACSSALKLTTTLTLVALHNFSADSEIEHSLKQGETLYPSPQADLAAEWIWCKNAAGKGGYVPKCYVKIEGGNAK